MTIRNCVTCVPTAVLLLVAMVFLAIPPSTVRATDPPPEPPPAEPPPPAPEPPTWTLIREPAFNPGAPLLGRLRLVDPDGNTVQTWTSPQPNDMFGLSAIVLPDVNGDGIPDAAIAAPNAFDEQAGVRIGTIRIASGADGSTITTLSGTPLDRFGLTMFAAADPATSSVVVTTLVELLDPATNAPYAARAFTFQSFDAFTGAFTGESLQAPSGFTQQAARDSLATHVRAAGPADLNADGEVGAWDLSILAGNYGTAVDPVTGELLQQMPGLAAAPTGDTNGDGVVNEQDLATVLGSFGQSTDPNFAPVEGVLTEAEASELANAIAEAGGRYIEADCALCTYRPCWCRLIPEEEDDPDRYDEIDGDEDGSGNPGSDNPPDPGDGGPDADEDGDEVPNKDDCDSARAGKNASCDCAHVTVRTNILGDTDMDGSILHDVDEERRLDHDDNAQTPEREFEELGAPGLIVLVNDDDDDEDGAPDREQISALRHFTVDDELVLVHLQITPNRKDMGKWKLTYNPDVFRIWTTRSRETVIEPGVEDFLPVPFTVFVEALAPTGIGTESIRLDFVLDPEACAGDLDGSFAGQEAKFNDTIRLTAVRLEMFDLRHWGPGYNSGAEQPFIQNLNLDATGMPVGGAITDGASICLLRLTPPLSEHVKDNIDDDDNDVVDDEYWEVIEPQAPFGGIEIDAAPRKSPQNFHPDVVGSLYPLHRPFDPPDPPAPADPIPPLSWNTVAGLNTLPQLPVIETDVGRATTDVHSDDGLWYYVPPERFVEANGLDPLPGDVEKAILNIHIRFNGLDRGEMDFILRRPPIVLVHGLMGSALNYWGGYAYSESFGHPLPTRLYYVDYESTNTQGYSENLWTLHHMLEWALDDYRLGRDATPNHKVAHTPARGFDEVRYAATRADVVGHSMGGQIARAYITNLGNTTPPTTNAVIRGGAWAAAVFGRGASPGDSRYISPRNWGAGAIRRFIAIGSPFKGSPIGDLVAPHLDPTLRNCRKLAGLKALFPEVSRNSLYRKLFSDPDRRPAPTAYIPPTAVADLSVDSPVQQALEASWRYPIGRRKVPWYALVGVATEPAGQDPIQAVAWELLFTFLRVDSDLTAIEPLNPTNSDLVVSQWSQRNADDENDYPNAQFPSFSMHVHTFGFAKQYGFQPETESDFMSHVTGDSARFSIRELLSLPRSHMMIGELH